MVGEGVAPFHDEEVLIVVSEDGVLAVGVLQVQLAEGVAYPGHEHIVEVEQVHLVLAAAVEAVPAVAKGSCHHAAVKLRAVLRVVHQAHFCGGLCPLAELTTGKGELEVGKSDTHLCTVLYIILVGVAVQSPDGFVCPSQLDAEELGSAEDVPVLVGCQDGSPQVTGRVGSFQFQADGVDLAGEQRDIGMEQGTVVRFGRKLHVGAHHSSQSHHPRVSVLYVRFPVQVSLVDLAGSMQHLGTYAQRGGRVVALHEVYVPDAINLVGLGLRKPVPAIGPEFHFQVHLPVAHCGIGLKVDEILVEPVVAVVEQEGVQPRPFSLQLVQVEVHARVEQGLAVDAVQQGGNAFILYLAVERAHLVAWAGINLVEQMGLVAFGQCDGTHGSVQVTLMLHGGLQVVLCLQGCLFVIDDRCFSQLAHKAVDALGAIGAGQTVDAQRRLHTREPPVVGVLAYVALQVRGFERGTVAIQAHLVQQRGSFGKELGH